MIVDTHAHVFVLEGEMASGRRYTPAAPAPPEAYAARLDGAGVTHGVLVQPSFLGTDNRYMAACLAAADGRFRGIAVVDSAVADSDIDALDAAGVVGMRLNLLGADTAPFAAPAWQALYRRVAARGWQIEVHVEGARLPGVLDLLWPCGAPLVVDHFGRPDPAAGVSDPGFRAMLERAGDRRLWVKLSGPYRALGDCRAYAAALLARLGPERLLWGSDWPWTQHPEITDYPGTLAWLDGWVPDAAARRAILADTPSALFGFRAGSPTV